MAGYSIGIINPATAFPVAALTDRIVALGAGTGQTGNRVFLAGQNAGQFTTMSDLIVIGNSDLSAGSLGTPLNIPALAESTIVGSKSLPVLTAASSGGAGQAPLTVFGGNNLPLATDANSSVILGSNILTTWGINPGGQPIADNVLIGDSVGQNLVVANFGAGSGYSTSVVIGRQAGSGSVAGSVKPFTRNVIIGQIAVNALTGTAGTGGPGCDQNVVIGHNAGAALGNVDSATGAVKNVIVGEGANCTGTAGSNTIIGQGANTGGPAVAAQFNVCLGASAACIGSANTMLGAFTSGGVNANRLIFIGGGAANGGNNNSDLFLVETSDGVAPRRTMFFGVMCDGATAGTGLVFGFSTQGTNRDIVGTNTFKILNGTRGAGNPVGGGFFYVNAGALHWVGSAGTDTTVAVA